MARPYLTIAADASINANACGTEPPELRLLLQDYLVCTAPLQLTRAGSQLGRGTTALSVSHNVFSVPAVDCPSAQDACSQQLTFAAETSLQFRLCARAGGLAGRATVYSCLCCKHYATVLVKQLSPRRAVSQRDGVRDDNRRVESFHAALAVMCELNAWSLLSRASSTVHMFMDMNCLCTFRNEEPVDSQCIIPCLSHPAHCMQAMAAID